MRFEKIEEILQQLNLGLAKDLVFTRQLTASVEIAKVWLKEPELGDVLEMSIPSKRFFFIKSNGNYVGAVYDAGNDLQWYVLPNYRKMGLMFHALNETILPYIFQRLRSEVSLSISRHSLGDGDYKNSKRLALLLGFVDVKGSIFTLKSNDFTNAEIQIVELNKTISDKRIKELKRKAQYAYKLLIQINDEVVMSYGDEADLGFGQTDILSVTNDIDNLLFKSN